MSLWPRYSSLAMAFMCMRRILIRFCCFTYFHPLLAPKVEYCWENEALTYKTRPRQSKLSRSSDRCHFDAGVVCVNVFFKFKFGWHCWGCRGFAGCTLRSHLSQGQNDKTHRWCFSDFCQLFQITKYSHLWRLLASSPTEHPCPLTRTEHSHMPIVAT